ncbi:MAG: sensor histidine kinase, partial [Gaiellales bacterium]
IVVGAGMWLGESAGGEIASILIVIVSIGAVMAAFGRKIAANHELHVAREELAVLAVSEERLRIARDLHDLLGHSLSVIALKSELAARLLEREPESAAREIDDIRAVTRQALAEVREAVQGYRRQGLADALERAEAALAAAGIACELDRTPVSLPADVESVLAWAVREGTTNVVRHSGAGHCSIRVRDEGDAAAVEVSDDGRRALEPALAGSGLTGLAERAETLHGTLEAGASPSGGFRLRLSIPLQRA